MERLETTVDVQGPWSLATSQQFWEGFTPSALTSQDGDARLRTVFRVDRDWSRAEVEVTQVDGAARLALTGDGDLAAAAAQVRRFLALDVDARGWPDVGRAGERGRRTAEVWRPFRTWAAVLLRALREQRTAEIAGPR